MSASIALRGQRRTVWLLAFFSPTAYLLLLLLARRSEIPEQLKPVILLLFCLTPAVSLVICESVVWRSSMTVVRKIGWMLFTLLAMLLQICVLAAIIRVILIAAIGYAQ
jgi:hypothetical protein